MTAADLAPDEHAYVAPEGTAVPPLAIAHPAIAEWAAMSPARQTLMRADMLVRKLDEAGVGVLSVQTDSHIAIQVEDGMVLAASFALGWTHQHEVHGDVDRPSERVCSADGPNYAVDRVYGAVSAR